MEMTVRLQVLNHLRAGETLCVLSKPKSNVSAFGALI